MWPERVVVASCRQAVAQLTAMVPSGCAQHLPGRLPSYVTGPGNGSPSKHREIPHCADSNNRATVTAAQAAWKSRKGSTNWKGWFNPTTALPLTGVEGRNGQLVPLRWFLIFLGDYILEWPNPGIAVAAVPGLINRLNCPLRNVTVLRARGPHEFHYRKKCGLSNFPMSLCYQFPCAQWPLHQSCIHMLL